jgi:glycosyltransferase 2 family protein
MTGRLRFLRRIRWKPVIAVAALSLAAILLYRVFSAYSLAEITASLREFPVSRIAACLVFAAASYFCLGFFDFFGLHYAGRPLAYRRTALASFTALSIGHNIGLAALSSGAVRYRFYSRWGLSGEQVAKVIVFCGATVGVGLATLGGAALALRPEMATDLAGFSQSAALMLGVACLACVSGYVIAAALVDKPLHLWKWSFRMPSWRLAIAQLLIGSVNFALVAGCLHQAISVAADLSYFQTATAYVLANTAALFAHLPGGLGVIEAVVTRLAPQAGVIGGLLVFRLTYFFVPLFIGGAAFAVSELVFRRRGRQKAGPCVEERRSRPVIS